MNIRIKIFNIECNQRNLHKKDAQLKEILNIESYTRSICLLNYFFQTF